jgi:hypothetical protein
MSHRLNVLKFSSANIIFILLISGCGDSTPGDFYTAEGFKMRKESICRSWDFFLRTDNLLGERNSIIQELEPGFEEMSELLGSPKFFDAYIAAQRYREDRFKEEQMFPSDVAARISEWCQAVKSGTD